MDCESYNVGNVAKNAMQYETLGEARKRELESIIADKTGKQVEVRFMLAADEGAHRGKLVSIDIDERIREFIHADIEIEDEN